jgi:hypothetical protein
MRKRLLILDGVVLAVALVAAAAVLLLANQPRTPLRAEYDRVRRGMTREEVRAIMGKPAATGYGPNNVLRVEFFGYCPFLPSSIHVRREDPSPTATVEFTDGRVTRKTWDDWHEPTALERLLKPMLAPVRDRFDW